MKVLFWYWDRQYEAAKRRMVGCTHESTQLENHGAPVHKCLRCWAIKSAGVGPVFDWSPNSARPKLWGDHRNGPREER